MGSGADTTSENDPHEKLVMRVNGTTLLRDSPMLLQSFSANTFTIWGVDWPFGTECRLAAVSGGELVDIMPDSNTWVKTEPGLPGWSITPKSAEGSLKLVLYSRSFLQTLEFCCEFFEADHPWYPASKLYVNMPGGGAWVTHKAVIPIAFWGAEYRITLSRTGSNLYGKETKLVFTGNDELPDYSPVEPQPLLGQLRWNVKLKNFSPVTAWIVSDDVPKNTCLNFVHTRVAIEAVSSNSEHSGVENSTDSAKE